LCLGEGRIPSRYYVGRGKVPVAGEGGVGASRRLVERRRAGRPRARRAEQLFMLVALSGLREAPECPGSSVIERSAFFSLR
jgi:hypothetical protein